MTCGSANAATLTENFTASFPAWQSGWFGLNSNAQNYYANPSDRGNNLDGLWVKTTAGLSPSPIDVVFNTPFAQSLNSFALDVAGYAPTTLTFFDAAGLVLSSTNVTLTSGATFNPGQYVRYSVNSTSGIRGFSFSGGASGNTSIDNLVAVTADATPAVPEPATWAMMLVGFGLIGATARYRRRTTKIAYA